MATNEDRGRRNGAPNSGDGGTRRYRKRKRADQEAETRRRIVRATMELHQTVGPAGTTVTEVAEKAGVSRMTVYNHFPSDAHLIEACMDHWRQGNPLPDTKSWAAIRDPDARLGVALVELYGWYARTPNMVDRILRDAPIVPALEELVRARWWTFVRRMVDTLAMGREVGETAGSRVLAALQVALAFETWRTLTAAGLDDGDAAEVAAGFVIVTDSSFAAS